MAGSSARSSTLAAAAAPSFVRTKEIRKQRAKPILARSILEKRAYVAFPMTLTWITHAMRLLPAGLYVSSIAAGTALASKSCDLASRDHNNSARMLHQRISVARNSQHEKPYPVRATYEYLYPEG